MNRQEFNTLSFDEVMEQLNNENDSITTIENLKDFIKYQIDNDNLFLALHVLQAIEKASKYYDWYDYDFSMGTLDTPCGIDKKEDVEHLIED